MLSKTDKDRLWKTLNNSANGILDGDAFWAEKIKDFYPTDYSIIADEIEDYANRS